MPTNKENLYGWLFTFNPYTNTWYAAKREDYMLLFNNLNSDGVLKSSEITTLVTIISRTGGDEAKIKKLLNTTKG